MVQQIRGPSGSLPLSKERLCRRDGPAAPIRSMYRLADSSGWQRIQIGRVAVVKAM
jgi:hypothetical protein